MEMQELYDYIIQDIPGIEEEFIRLPQINAVRADDGWFVASGTLPADRQLNISSLGYATIPKLYGLMEDTDLTVLEEIGATRVLGLDNLKADGSGVLIGYIDTGIDYTKSVFINEIGNTYIETIWDQNTDEVYDKHLINEALRANRDGKDPYEIVPQRDENGHGTMLASLRIALKSSIAMVKLKPAKKYLKDFYLVKDDAVCYQENDIMLGVKFLKDKANELKMPLVIVIGLGTANGSRTGDSPLSDMLDKLTLQPGMSVVTCTGNEADTKGHYKGRISSALAPDVFEINVSDKGKGFFLEIWAESLDILSVSVESPSGESVPRIPARMGTRLEYSFLYEGSRLSVDYQIAENISGMEVVYLTLKDPTPGVWKISVYSLTDIKGTYNAWLPLEQFLDQETFFLRPDPDITLTEPSCASRVISVGGYNHKTGGSFLSSGRGFTSDGKIKPELIAPAKDILTVKPIGFVTSSGTSLAAAITASAVALLFSYAVNKQETQLLYQTDVKAALIRGAVRNPRNTYPNQIEGFGKLNILGAFEQFRKS